MFQDRDIKCIECGAEFPFSASEQQFYEERGFHSPPRRCRECRKSRRDQPGSGGGPGGGGGGPRHDRGHGAGGGDRPRREDRPSFPATCSACGAETTVPFKPDPARATFCRACYADRRGR